ncbi:MAG: HAMP domain-containing histidine kinase, partial [Hyphomicrobiaceae bacterium]|nr:HAMP domain-containing histidine kinase [Hyphomicrobiaceae bacterium]
DEITAAFFERDSFGVPRAGGGYGIGLPLVRRLAEAMSATIDVDSAPGKGTAVLITFPS